MQKKNPEKWLKLWHMGTHLRVLSKSYPMNTNMTGLEDFQQFLHPYAFDESSLSIWRVNSWESCSFDDADPPAKILSHSCPCLMLLNKSYHVVYYLVSKVKEDPTLLTGGSLIIRAALTEGDQLMTSPPVWLVSSWAHGRYDFPKKTTYFPAQLLRNKYLLAEIY